jgi:hypothetical protein
VGTGAACGAFQLEERFKEVLRRKLGGYVESVLTTRRLEEATTSFQDNIKTQFNPYDKDSDDDDYRIRLPGAPELPAIGLEGSYLEFTQFCLPHTQLTAREDCKQVFEPVFLKIRRLIEAQIEDVKRKTRSPLKVYMCHST